MQTGGFGCPSFLSYGCYRSVTERCKYLIIIYYKPIIRSIFYSGWFDAGITDLPEQRCFRFIV